MEPLYKFILVCVGIFIVGIIMLIVLLVHKDELGQLPMWSQITLILITTFMIGGPLFIGAISLSMYMGGLDADDENISEKQ